MAKYRIEEALLKADRLGIKTLGWVVAGAILLALAAQARIYLPFTPVPVTAQTLAVFLLGLFLGNPVAPAAVGLYLILGILGLPYFAGPTGGLFALSGPTGGYLLGFLGAAYLVARLRNSFQGVKVFALLILAQLVIYTLGVMQLWLWSVGMKGLPVTLSGILYAGVWPFLPGDLIKILLAGGLYLAWSGLRRERG